jgi:hypothetical protein
MEPSSLYLRREAAAKYIEGKWGVPCSPKTLAKYAVQGGGPIFSKFGRYPLYTAENLDAWARARIGQPIRSTSEYAASSPKESSCQDERSVLTSVGTVTNSSDLGKVV